MLARPIKFAHVVYRTRRYQEMIRWYQTVFEAKVQYENPAIAFLTFDDEHHRFAIANMDTLAPNGNNHDRRGETGVDHVAYTYGTIGDLLENYASLKEAGIAPYWCIHHGVTASMYYSDPDGNQMEFQVDCLPTNALANEFMTTIFADNPIGVEYDPDDWLTRYRAGAPDSEFLERPADQPISPIRGQIERLIG
jgi:catechol 2,3-dioxygenase-like lactoylglutathione lyase family enzyme